MLDTPIIYKEHGYTFKVFQISPASGELKNMRDNKVFYLNETLHINLQGKLYQIDEYTVTNETNQPTEKPYNIDTAVRVAGVVIESQKVLLLHRKKQGREYYVFPGGHLRLKDSAIDTVIREIKEECGIDVNKAELILELQEQGFGREMFYQLVPVEKNQKLFDANPDAPETELSRPIWIDIKKAVKLQNLYPKQIKEYLISLI